MVSQENAYPPVEEPPEKAFFLSLSEQYGVKVSVSDRKILIQTNHESGYDSEYPHFEAYLGDFLGGKGSYIGFDLLTVDKSGNRVPVFNSEETRVTNLSAMAIKFLDSCLQKKFKAPIKSLQVCWDKAEQSDNLHAYRRNREKFLNEGLPLEEAQKRAVATTWTYNRIAKPNYFTGEMRIKETFRMINGIETLVNVTGFIDRVLPTQKQGL